MVLGAVRAAFDGHGQKPTLPPPGSISFPACSATDGSSVIHAVRVVLPSPAVCEWCDLHTLLAEEAGSCRQRKQLATCRGRLGLHSTIRMAHFMVLVWIGKP